MTDIVQRLRDHGEGWLDGTEGGKLLSDAADEIERLERAQGELIDACGLALNYHQEAHVHRALREAITAALSAEAER